MQRITVSAKDRFLGLEAEPKNFSEDISQSSNTRNSLICIKTVVPVKKKYFLKTRSLQLGNGYHVTELVTGNDVCFPSILNNAKC